MLIDIIKKSISKINLILTDSLTNKDGKFSSKKLTCLASFIMAVFISTVDMFTKYKMNLDVFYAFLLTSTGHSVLSIIGNNADKSPKPINALPDMSKQGS